MTTIGIIRSDGIDELVTESSTPKLIFGVNNIRTQKRERRAIGNALKATGLEVFATAASWPNDLYVLNNGLVIAERDFGELAHGGNYLFSNGFVLVSTSIEDKLRRQMRDSRHFRDFLGDNEIIFVPPYRGKIVGIDDFALETEHIDTTVGHIPTEKILSIDSEHYAQQEHLFDALRKHFGSTVILTGRDGMPNNYYVITYDGQCIAVVNRQNNPFRSRQNSFRVIETRHDITNLPGKFGGSVKCAVNSSPTAKLWDRLGIDYTRWDVPQKSDYAKH